MKDYYRILEVHPEASPEVITRAYRTLAQKHHPDCYHLSDKSRVTERMQDINTAYETLGDTNRRTRYDQDYSRYLQEQPLHEKVLRRGQVFKKLGYGFLLTVLLCMMIRDGIAAALLMVPLVRIIALILLVLGVGGFLNSRRNLR